jgi:hypothetical protein
MFMTRSVLSLGPKVCRFLLAAALFLIASGPVTALTEDQIKVLDNLKGFYTKLGMGDKVTLLEENRTTKKIVFGPLPGDVAAECDHATGIITVNNIREFKTYQQYIELGETFCHEAVHQNQDLEGWNNQLWREKYWLGNTYEQAAWAEGIRSIRRMTFAIKREMDAAPSARDKAAWANRLDHAVRTWRSVVDGWREEKKKAGEMVVVDHQGFPIPWDDMAREMEDLLSQAKAGTITSGAVVRPYAGDYQGKLTSGAEGIFNFKIEPDGTVNGRIRGTSKHGLFHGEIRGTVTTDGRIAGTIIGIITVFPKDPLDLDFTGSASGQFQGNSQASGRWSSGEMGPSGTWSVRRK